jgi:glycerophosphoryl diester phosphodiesterase
MATSFLIDKKEKRTLSELWDVLGFVPTALSPEYVTVTDEMVRDCHAAGVKIIPWTVNDRTEIEKLVTMKVDGIISDFPNLFENIK